MDLITTIINAYNNIEGAEKMSRLELDTQILHDVKGGNFSDEEIIETLQTINFSKLLKCNCCENLLTTSNDKDSNILCADCISLVKAMNKNSFVKNKFIELLTQDMSRKTLFNVLTIVDELVSQVNELGGDVNNNVSDFKYSLECNYQNLLNLEENNFDRYIHAEKQHIIEEKKDINNLLNLLRS